MKMLFCNIGWMNRYKGKDGDPIYGGGSFNEDNTGSGVCNFSRAAVREIVFMVMSTPMDK